MQRRYVFIGLILALLVGVFFYLRAEQRTQIDFEQVEPIPGYKMEMREPPLRRDQSAAGEGGCGCGVPVERCLYGIWEKGGCAPLGDAGAKRGKLLFLVCDCPACEQRHIAHGAARAASSAFSPPVFSRSSSSS